MQKKKEKKCRICGLVKPRKKFQECKHGGLRPICKECSLRILRTYKPRNGGFQRYAAKAKKLGLPYDSGSKIREWFETQELTCEYCGKNLKPSGKDRDSVSIDRVIPSEGYIIENLVLACHRCNRVKSDILSFEEMKEVAEMYDFRHRP